MPERVRVQREGAQLQAQGKWSAGEGDNKQRFLADLRSLRDTVALEFDELAARAHYPSDVLKEAESGPSLPTLPILAAYVRACEGDVPEWEERWRRLGAETETDPGLPVRSAGASPAAVAGARAAVSVAPPDAYDPERIRAALRGSQGRSDQRTRGTASPAASVRDTPSPATTEPRVPDSPVSWSAGTNWDQTTAWDDSRSAETASDWGTGFQPEANTQPTTSWDGFRRDASTQPATSWDEFQPDAGARWDDVATDLSDPPANGNHPENHPVSYADDAASDTAVIPPPDAARAHALRRDPFSADWLQDSELTVLPEAGRQEAELTPPPEPGWQDSGLTPSPEAGQQEAEPPSDAEDTWFTPRQPADPERTWSDADTEVSSPATPDWFTPREPAADGLTPTERDLEAHAGSTTAQVTGFWTPSTATSAPTSGLVSEPASEPASELASEPASEPASELASELAEVKRADPPSAHDRTIPRTEWPGTAETPASEPRASRVSAADRTMPVAAREAAAASLPPLAQTARVAAAPALGQTARVAAASALGQTTARAAAGSTVGQTAGAASARTIAGPAVPPGPVVRPSESRSDRAFLVRLLVIIVVAALVGSILVLLVR